LDSWTQALKPSAVNIDSTPKAIVACVIIMYQDAWQWDATHKLFVARKIEVSQATCRNFPS
jgi:hypothetical protein